MDKAQAGYEKLRGIFDNYLASREEIDSAVEFLKQSMSTLRVDDPAGIQGLLRFLSSVQQFRTNTAFQTLSPDFMETAKPT